MAPAYAVPRMLERAGLTLQDFDFYEIHEAFAAQVLCTLRGLGGPGLLQGAARPRRAARLDRPRQAQRQRQLARRRPPVRRDRRPDRRQPRQGAARARPRPRPDLDLRGRRPGRRRDPRGPGRADEVTDRYIAARQLAPSASSSPNGRPAAADPARPLRAGRPGRRRAACCSARAPGGRLGAALAGVLAGAGAAASTPHRAVLARRRRGGRARRRAVQPRDRAATSASRRSSSTRPGSRTRPSCVELQRLLPPDDPPARARGRVVVLGTPPRLRRPARGDRPAGARGLHALARQGGRARRDGPARLRRAGRRGRAGLDAALPALAAVGLRLRPGRAGRRRASRRPRTSTGSSRSPARSRSSPAPRAASAPRSPRRSPATARTSSASTCRRSRRDLEDGRAAPRRLALALDITDEDAPAAIAEQLERHGGVDIVVHNAGITRDKTLGAGCPRTAGAG